VARGRELFDADSIARDAILYQIVVLGEASKAVVAAEPSIAAELSGIEWSALARMRDRVTHQYWKTNPGIVWATATTDVPEIRALLSEAVKRWTDQST
jgi:uncharacterized protein with HEPN domain